MKLLQCIYHSSRRRLSAFSGPALAGVLILASCSCGNRVRSVEGSDTAGVRDRQESISGTRVMSPSPQQQITSGANIEFRLEEISDTLPSIDSIEIRLDNVPQAVLLTKPYSISLGTEGLSVGTKNIRAVCYYHDGRKEFHNTDVTILSDITPRYLSYRIMNTWPHDPAAYTQGLVYEDGYLYEGTGQWGESSLRRTVIETGEPERILSLADDVFGEGIALFRDRIYQLTYKSQVGFVYEKETFRRIQKVYYENKEGWGLTHDGENLIMSDGTNRIYYMDPEYFTELRRVEVYNHESPVNRLNELEYIEGRIFANIYGEEEIVVIDPGSGKVTALLNMKGLLKEEDKHRKIDVFNGIAWNPDLRIMYVTGKYWPKLFEVSLEGEF